MSRLLLKRGRLAQKRWRDSAPSEEHPFDSAYDDVRLFKHVGIFHQDSWSGTASQMDSLYSTFMKPAYHNPPANDVYFMARLNISWRDCLDDETVTPTLAQMRDHTWSGYNWPARIDTVRNATCVQDGKAKVGLKLNVSATAGDPTPTFMLQGNGPRTQGTESDWAWCGSGNQVRVKFYNATARQYAANFILAALDRYVGLGVGGDNVGNIKLGEYFAGAYKPADWTTNTPYHNGWWTMMGLISSGMSVAADGMRPLIEISNPVETSENTYASLIPLKMGITDSDQHLFNESSGVLARDAYYNVIPQEMPDNGARYTDGTTTNWEVPPPNPFGFTNNQTVDFDPVHALWFYGSQGVLRQPLNFMVAYAAANVNTAQGKAFHTALDRFGPGGTDRATWGGAPHMG